MADGDHNSGGVAPGAADVRGSLERILASEYFVTAPRVQQFLRFVVEETLAGRGGEIKETVIATRVFNRRGDFDPRYDSVVRVEATHVRKRLADYYAGVGRQDPVVIDFPKRGYVPVFRAAASAGGPPRARKPARVTLWLAAALVVAAAGYLGYSRWWRSGDRPAIAVMPFLNLDGLAETNLVADGLAEDLTVSLAQTPGLRVVARSSAFQFRGKQTDPRAAGKQLGAEALVEGSVRRRGDRVTVTVQLVSVANGYDLWSGSYDGAVSGLPVIQEQITRAVRQYLKAPASLSSSVYAKARREIPPAALEAYWRGRSLMRQGVEGRAASVRQFEDATRLAPEYAPAHAAMATAYATMTFHLEGNPEELAAKARQAGRRALQLDPGSSEAYASLAVVSFAHDRDWAAAQSGFERSLELNPNYARGHLQYSLGLLSRGRFDDAIEHIQDARTLDPLAYSIGNELAVAYYCAGRFDDSLTAARSTLAMDKDFTPALLIQGCSLAGKGDNAAAIRAMGDLARRVGREPYVLGRLGYAVARTGRKKEAEELLAEIKSGGGTFMHQAYVLGGIGDKGRALDAVEAAAKRRETDVIYIGVDPMLAGLRTEPRFAAIKHSIGLP